MRKHLIAVCAVLLTGLTGCTTGPSSADRNGDTESADAAPSVANFVGRTKEEAQAALSGTGTVFGFQDTKSNLRSDSEYDSWIVCKQDASKEPVWFTVAASREACGLPAAPPNGESESPSPSSPSSEATDPTVDQDSRYAAAVKAQVPKLRSVADDGLGVQGRLVCTLLDSGDSPKSVLGTMQAAYPDNAGRVMVIEAPPVYCSKYTAKVKRALK